MTSPASLARTGRTWRTWRTGRTGRTGRTSCTAWPGGVGVRTLAALALVVLSTTACSQHRELSTDTVTGAGGRMTRVLVDETVYPEVQAEFEPFLNRRPGRVGSGAGPGADIVATVKDGQAVDAVVMPAGPDLDRVRDELVLPPKRIGSMNGSTYWAGAVSSRGLAFVSYLTGRAGQRLLHAQGFR